MVLTALLKKSVPNIMLKLSCQVWINKLVAKMFDMDNFIVSYALEKKNFLPTSL